MTVRLGLNALIVITSVAVGLAQGSPRLLHDRDLAVIAAPTFDVPLDATWSVAQGKWTPEGGVLSVVELAANKHSAVLHHNVGLASAVIECDFRLDAPGVFYVGCDAKTHVGRVVIRPDGMIIAEDSVKPSHTLATLKTPVAVGEWHHLRVEWQGDRMAARLDGRELRAQHPYLATPKSRSWLAVGKAATVRALTISGVSEPVKP